MNETTTENKSAGRPSRRELRASLILPVIITLVVWLLGLLIFTLAPHQAQFNNIFAVIISGALLAVLVYTTRQASARERGGALLLAVPALAGITTGVLQGSAQLIVGGVGVTFLLLVAQRALSVPISYRLASRRFQMGDYDEALTLVNKSLAARPDFAESYQLRALIRMLYQQVAQADQDMQQAIALRPTSPQFHNTLGQIYLTEGRYEAARDVYETAVALEDRQAMYHYYLGLSHYRLGAYRAAAEALTLADKKTLATPAFDLLNQYYLSESLDKIGQPTLAATARQTMQKFSHGLPQVKAQLADQPDAPHFALLRQDVADLAAKLKSG